MCRHYIFLGIGVSPNFKNEVKRLPWVLPDYQIFNGEIHSWGIDRLPPGMMKFDLPDRYKSKTDFHWSVDLVRAPTCKSHSPYLNLVKSGRNNENLRKLIRSYLDMVKQHILHLPDLSSFPEGKY